jgi:hypothetical protein
MALPVATRCNAPDEHHGVGVWPHRILPTSSDLTACQPYTEHDVARLHVVHDDRKGYILVHYNESRPWKVCIETQRLPEAFG